MAGGDQSIFLNPNALWDRTVFAWDTDSTNLMGWLNPSFAIAMPFLLFFKFFFFLPNIVTEYLYFAVAFSAIFLSSFYYFYYYLFHKNFAISIICSLAYFFNAFFFVSFLNYNIHLAFILLPILFILANKIIEGDIKKIILLVILVSVIIPSVFINPPSLIPLILVAFSYLIFLAIQKGINKKLFSNLGLAGILFILLNIWWIYPFIYTIFNNRILETLDASSLGFFGTTSLYDSFRFLGGWSFGTYSEELRPFRYEHLYLLNPIFIICNYIIIVSAYSVIVLKKNKNILYFFALSLIGIFLIKGNLKPLGELYMFMFDNAPGMYMFREPFAKFMLIQVFSICCLLGYFLRGIRKKKYFKLVYIILLLAIFIPSYPFLVGGFTFNIHLGGTRSYLVKIPSYLQDYGKYVSAKKLEYRVLSTPMDSSIYLWESGFNINNTALKFFGNKSVLNHSSAVINYFSPESDLLCSSSYDSLKRQDVYLNNYLGLMNVGQIAQENSKDWRFHDFVFSPSQMEYVFNFYQNSGLIKKDMSFGEFSSEYLDAINMGTPQGIDLKYINFKINKSKAVEITRQELLGKPAIELYSINRDNFVPHIYAPQNVIISKEPTAELSNILDSGNFKPGSSIFFMARNIDKMEIVADWYRKKEVELQNPVLEFRKIDAAKYRVRVHGASGLFPLVFSENYHDGWKAYLKKYGGSRIDPAAIGNYQITKENEDDQAGFSQLKEFVGNGWVTSIRNPAVDFVSKKFKGTIQNENLPHGNFWETWTNRNALEIPDKNHLVANSYANSWIINPEELCNKSKNGAYCQKNPDGTYDMELVIEFHPQWFYYIGPAVSIITLVVCFIFIIIHSGKFKFFNKNG